MKCPYHDDPPTMNSAPVEADKELESLFMDWVWAAETANIVVGEKPTAVIFKKDLPRFKTALLAWRDKHTGAELEKLNKLIDNAFEENGDNTTELGRHIWNDYAEAAVGEIQDYIKDRLSQLGAKDE